ncbi:unnamed protein product [Sympodiomycopsis kandeliae]
MASQDGLSVEQALSQPIEQMDLSSGSGSSSSNGANGKHASDTENGQQGEAESDSDTTLSSMSKSDLIAELRQARSDRDGFENQYKTLLGKLSLMRSTLGDRLRQDAEELDKRETQIDTLSNQVEELNSTVTTLQSELVSSHADNERVTKELDALRQAAVQSKSTQDSDEREQESEAVQRMTLTVESLKSQVSSWESSYHEERSRREATESELSDVSAHRSRLEEDIRNWQEISSRDRESARNLQMVLEEFQSDQESELERAIGDYQQRYTALENELETYKTRSQEYETKYTSVSDISTKYTAIQQEIKEKNLLIGKLRHEAVILNEHLTESLKKLQLYTNHLDQDENVNRQLISNVLLQFLMIPRSDVKRFQILKLIGEILSWGPAEMEAAGLVSSSNNSKTEMKNREGASGSVSNAFVEFLLSEADQRQRQEEQKQHFSAPPQEQEEEQLSKHMRNASIASSRRTPNKGR